MAMLAYMKIKVAGSELHTGAGTKKSMGPSGGAKIGDTEMKDFITIVGFKAGIVLPQNITGGAQSGAMLYQPVTFTKYVDKTSPQLWEALCRSKAVDEVSVEFYRGSTEATGGAAEKFFTIKWETGLLVEGKNVLPLVIDPNQTWNDQLEEWSFTYQKVSWRHEKDNTEGAFARI